jgi:predicted AAA+ superfamily ATPase
MVKLSAGESMTDQDKLLATLSRIASALDRLAPLPPAPPMLSAADAFIWDAKSGTLRPVARVAAVAMEDLRAIDLQKDILLANTRQFARGLSANNALLWGARGMGKSSLVKAVHGALIAEISGCLKLIELHREEIASLPLLLEHLRDLPDRILIFCDDLSFETQDADYKALKSVLDGGIAGRPANVIFYATSNRRHLMPRDMIENEQQRGLTPGEAVEEKVSLSDRFGLWLGFHNCGQQEFLAMVANYAAQRKITIQPADLRARAIAWAATRGSRSGRVAFQFIEDLAGKLA